MPPEEPQTPQANPPAGAPPSSPPSEVKVPERFLRDGKPDYNALTASYLELDTKFKSKTDQLREEIAAENLRNRPEAADKYDISKIEGVDPEELGSHPMLGWWREQAFEAGIPQDKFEAGIKQYLDIMQPQEIPEETLRETLGENFKQRIAAVDAWAKKTAKSQGEMDALQGIAINADGIKLLERFAGLGGAHIEGDPIPNKPTLTLDELRSMQQDAKYWDPAQRDPGFVKQVEEGYAKLYPDQKRA